MKKLLTLFAMVCLAALQSNAQISTTVIANSDNIEITNSGSITYDVLCNDTYISLDSVTVTINTTPSNGIITYNGDGIFTYINTVDYSNETITYTLTHISGSSDPGTVNITNSSIAPANNPPIANDNNISDTGYVTLVMDVLGNDTDADNDSLIIISISDNYKIVSLGDSGTSWLDTVAYIHIVNNKIVFEPYGDSTWLGRDTITYTISDGNGGTSTATVFIQSGDSAQIIAYNIISPYFGIQMHRATSGWGFDFFTFNSNGTYTQIEDGPLGSCGSSGCSVNFNIKINGDVKLFNGLELSVAPFGPYGGSYYGYLLGGTYNYVKFP